MDKFWQKPTSTDIFKSLQNLKKIYKERKINRLSLSTFSRWLGWTKWKTIRTILYYKFRDSETQIKIITQEKLSEDEHLRSIQEFYDTPLEGHQGINRTYQRISQQHNWKRMRKMIKTYIFSFITCHRNKIPNSSIKEPMVITTTFLVTDFGTEFLSHLFNEV